MCTGGEMFTIGSQIGGGIAKQGYGEAQDKLAQADANYTRDAGVQQAERIMRAARREKSAARAATAASGTRIDEFSTINEQEIDTAAGLDAAMAVLTGQRRARTTEFSGGMMRAAGNADLTGSLFSAGSTAWRGWKGGKGTSKTDSLYFSGNRGMGD